MRGCLALPGRVLALLIVAGLLYLAWSERSRITGYWQRLTDRPSADAVGATGRPSDSSLRSASDKIDSLNGWRADSVVLTASEMASLIGTGLDHRVRSELDSLEVTLGADRISVAGRIRTAGLPREVLGPLAGAFDEREPIRAAGPVRVTTTGRASWQVDAFQVRDFEFPREVVPRIVGLVAGDKNDSLLVIEIPEGIGGVRVHPEGVTLYPSGRQP
jgi:hypothetical protein